LVGFQRGHTKRLLSNSRWNDVALFLQRNKTRLDEKHHEFVDDMATRTVWGREPTERQHKYLHSLFFNWAGRLRRDRAISD
jgi:hypothetical protein